VLRTYHNAIKKTTLAGPTYFAGFLKRFLKLIETEEYTNSKNFYVLVILTDGCIHDMKETSSLMVQLSYLPVSLIIVGIGDEDFSDMHTLDADQKILTDPSGRPAARDIVQFVQFKDF